MWSFIRDVALPLAGTFLVGAVGWWITHWIAAPVVALEKIRREAREELYFYRNVSKDWKPEKIDAASDALRRTAARIEAMSMAGVVRWYSRLRGWDLGAARSAFQGLANVLGTNRDEKTIVCHEIEVALGFPRSDTAERIERLKKRVDEKQD
jgi:hypothetical protein